MVHRGAPLLSSLTVADNVVLFDSPHHLASLIDDRDLRRKASETLESIGCSSLIGRPTPALGLWERIQVQAGRALASGVLGIAFENTCVDLPEEERGLFWDLLTRLAALGLAVVVLGYDANGLRDRVSRLTFVRDGRSSLPLNWGGPRTPPPQRPVERHGTGGLRFRGLRTAAWSCPDLEAAPGTVTSLVDFDGRATGEVSRLFRGQVNYQGAIEIGGRTINLRRPGACVPCGGLLDSRGPPLSSWWAASRSSSRWAWPVADDWLVPSDCEGPEWSVYLAAEWSDRLDLSPSDMSRLMNELHEGAQRRVVLQSLLLSRPRAAVFLQPGSHLDEPTACEVSRAMEELANKGSAVLKIVHQF